MSLKHVILWLSEEYGAIVEVSLKHVIQWLFLKYGTIMLVITEAPTVFATGLKKGQPYKPRDLRGQLSHQPMAWLFPRRHLSDGTVDKHASVKKMTVCHNKLPKTEHYVQPDMHRKHTTQKVQLSCHDGTQKPFIHGTVVGLYFHRGTIAMTS